jgi:stage VI sporulation protein D
MTDREQSKLRFSIEESVWLKNGQEVDQVLSMSLNPDITIQENNEQVVINGSLHLIGEYRQYEQPKNDNESEEGSLREQVAFRSLDQMSASDQGIAEIEHRFPVDITIPKHRIQNLDEIFVAVESFDYDLPSPTCIQLAADVAITGISQDASSQRPSIVEEEEEEEKSPVSMQVNEEQEELKESSDETWASFEFEARRVQEESSEPQQDESKEFVRNEDVNQGPQIELKGRSEDEEEESSEDLETVFERNDSFLHPLKSISGKQKDDEEISENFNNREDDYEEPEAVKSDLEEEVEHEEKRPREENALYLTSMLTKEDEEFSRLKMCIIQPGDSLDTIASRYEISTSHLLRVNRLDSEDVEEGQILYIPVTASR